MDATKDTKKCKIPFLEPVFGLSVLGYYGTMGRGPAHSVGIKGSFIGNENMIHIFR